MARQTGIALTVAWLALRLLSMVLPSGPLAAALVTTPEAVVERLHAGLQAIDRRFAADDRDGRRAATAELLAQTHDLEQMARLALGRPWRELDEAQRQRYLAAFVELSVSGYADNFVDIQGDRFETLESQPVSRGRVVVRTRLIPASGDPVAIDYTLEPDGDGWRIMHVRVDGVSDLALKRSQYSALLARDGFDALIEHIYAQAGVAESAPPPALAGPGGPPA